MVAVVDARWTSDAQLTRAGGPRLHDSCTPFSGSTKTFLFFLSSMRNSPGRWKIAAAHKKQMKGTNRYYQG